MTDSVRFAIELFRKLGISCHIVDDTDYHKTDLGMRSLFFGDRNYNNFLNHTLSEINDKTIYRYMDEYRCCYILMKLSEMNKYLFIGPYYVEFPDINFIRNKINVCKDSDKMLELIIKFYLSLPLIRDENYLISIATVLGKFLWKDENNFSFEYMDDIYFDNVDPISYYKDNHNETTTAFKLELVEAKMNHERILFDAISSGNINNLKYISSLIFNDGLLCSDSDSLRSRKNNLIVINTLLRKAAEQSGVHPIKTDKISTEFFKRIENLEAVSDCLELQNKMLNEYCFLVKKHSLSGYSSLIRRAISIIDFDISADLSLKAIADQLFISPSYLSAMFRREVGQTLTEFVNNRRIENAAKLMHKTDKQIQDIASQVGISDINYFIRLFKKKYNMTPTAYRKHIGK